MNTGYRVMRPEVQTTGVVFASPHSGREYPASLIGASGLDERTLRSSEDAFVDLLFECAPKVGAPLIVADVPRAYVDLNRSCDELDPALIAGVRRTSHNPRVSSGLGVIPRVVANGRAIYSGKISRAEAEGRLRDFWFPYHAKVQQLLNEGLDQFGQAVLVDCHSMPHEALDGVVHPNGIRPEIVLGDRFGAAAGSDVVERIEMAFLNAGLSVVRNAPFAGAYSAQRYGRPGQGRHVVQIEIDRSLYMSEPKIVPNENFAAFRDLLSGIVADIADVGRGTLPLAAE